jgi:hypothetical protein
MQTSNPLSTLRALKGAPLSCLFALMFSNQPVGKEWLARMTGYSDKPIANALNYLSELGYVSSNNRYESWVLNTEAVQLPLMTLEPGFQSSRNFSDSLPTTATTALIEEAKKQSIEAVEETNGSRNFSDSRRLLHSAGIGEPTATRLAKLDHINPYYIAGHILQAEKDEIRVNLLIHRLRSNDPAPDLNTRYHKLGCGCYSCIHLTYTYDKGILNLEDFDLEAFLESHQP